jgi:exosome complex RNA-binding protein Rrp4
MVKLMPIFFEKKQLVTPGEMLAEGDYLPGENTYVNRRQNLLLNELDL